MDTNLEEMTTEEKLKVMEMLWDDLCRRAPDFSSPSWHEDVLKERTENKRWKRPVCGLGSSQERHSKFDQMKIKILESAKPGFAGRVRFL